MATAALLCLCCLTGCSGGNKEGGDKVSLKVVTQFGGDASRNRGPA